MNPDGQLFHLLLGEADWGRSRGDGGTTLAEIWDLPIGDRPENAPGWDEERCELTLAPVRERLPSTPGEVPFTPEVRRAATRCRSDRRPPPRFRRSREARSR